MSNVREFQSTQSARTEQASAWITRLDKGLTADEELELGAWLSMSRENHCEFMEIAKLWDSMDGLSRLAAIFPEPAEQPAPQSSARPGRSVVSGWKIAASLMIALGAGGLWLTVDRAPTPSQVATVAPSPDAAKTYATAIGEQASFELSDGTRLVLNTNSEVEVAFTDKNRLLRLERGEIHVTVAHDPSRKLSVMVGNKIVQAIGTEFNVEITSDQSVELVVTDGVVVIGVLDAPTDGLQQDQPILLVDAGTMVAAGQQVIIDPLTARFEDVETEAIESEEIAVKLSWREGNLIFRGESLEEAMSEVGRYTAVEFVFLDEASKKKRLTGFFKAGDVDGLLVALRKNFSISYEWVGEDKILLSAQ